MPWNAFGWASAPLLSLSHAHATHLNIGVSRIRTPPLLWTSVYLLFVFADELVRRVRRIERGKESG
jgi:hypothetical protein